MLGRMARAPSPLSLFCLRSMLIRCRQRKAARSPFELRALTCNTDDKYFGFKVFVSLATLFQAPKAVDDEEDPSQGTSLIPRVSRTGALAQLCGPYSDLLYAIMGGITRMLTKLTPVGVLVPAIVSGPVR